VEIKKGKVYRIKGRSGYFAKRHGTPNPTILIEGKDTDLWPTGWKHQKGNPACILYSLRSMFEGLPTEGTVYYGKVGRLEELVHESELEEIKE